MGRTDTAVNEISVDSGKGLSSKQNVALTLWVPGTLLFVATFFNKVKGILSLIVM